MTVHLRQATDRDADAIAALFSRSLHSLDFMPVLYSREEERAFITSVILPGCDVWASLDTDDRITGFIALEGALIRLLYVDPKDQGAGYGTALVGAAKQTGSPVLQLRCFTANNRARHFYERHGFIPVAFGDGSDNEEGLPDILYEWRA